MRVRLSESNLDIDLISSYIFAEHPHFTLIIQCIHNLNEAVLVLLAIITETDSEDFDLQTKVLYEFLDLFFRNNSAKITIFF